MKSVTLFMVFGLALAHCQLLPMGEMPTKVTSFVRKAANFAVERLNFLMNCVCLDVLTDIDNATVEAVIGLMYRMDITMKDSNCTKQHPPTVVNTKTCPPKAGAVAKTCHVEVLDDSSNTPRYTLKNYKCQ